MTLPYAFEFHPRTEDFAFLNGKGEAVPFFGVDLIAESTEARLQTRDKRDPSQLADRDLLWVTPGLHLQTGQRVSLLINERLHEFRVAGVLRQARKSEQQQNVFLTDIAVAQAITGKQGILDSVDVHLPSDLTLQQAETILREHLPQSAQIAPQGARTDQNRKMLAAFRWNLRVLSYIALLVGGFLIYNTVSISVVRRRAEIGIVRALGATERHVLIAFLSEALLLSAIGSVLGVALGRLLSIGAVRLVSATVQTLYVTSTAPPVHLTAPLAIEGMVLGIGLSLLAALAPAMEAAGVAPIEAMARGRNEYSLTLRLRYLPVSGILMLIGAAILTQLPPVRRQPVFAYAAVLLLIGGTSMMIPNLVGRIAARGVILQHLFGVEAMLALRNLRASLTRTSVLVAALTTAISMTAAVAIMVGSFRQTVSVWMNMELTADFYLRPAGATGADQHPTLRASIADGLERIPGVATVDRFRAYSIAYEGLPATLAGGETSKVGSRGTTLFLPGENSQAILTTLPTGDFAIVSEPFANKHSVRVGDILRLPIGNGIHGFRVLGIYYDYSTERGFIILDRQILLKYLPDSSASNLAIYLKNGADASIVRKAINRALSGQAVLVFANGELRRGAIAIFDQTFRITYALELIAVIVAVLGIAGSLLAMVIDRRREVALLRFMGAANKQVRAIILWEAALIGLISSGIGLITGTALSLILIFVINKQSFGWTIQFHWPAALLLSMLAGIYAATIAAALYPARVAVQLNPIEAIYEE